MFTQSYGNGGTAWDSNNTAVGNEALYSNQPSSTGSGNNNTAVGSSALRSNVTGYLNTACSPDARMKKDVVTLSDEMDVLDALSKLRGVTFTWDRSNPKTAGMTDERDLGMIAQEVEQVFPEVVHTDSDGYKSMDYPKLVGFLIEVDRTQQEEFKQQQMQIDELKKMVEELREKL